MIMIMITLILTISNLFHFGHQMNKLKKAFILKYYLIMTQFLLNRDLTGYDLKILRPKMKYYKLTDVNDFDGYVNVKTGFYKIEKSCKKMHIMDSNQVMKYKRSDLVEPYWIREVTIPYDAIVITNYCEEFYVDQCVFGEKTRFRRKLHFTLFPTYKTCMNAVDYDGFTLEFIPYYINLLDTNNNLINHALYREPSVKL